jgi:RNA polymerase sigma-70 factor, ECF subfamily
LEGNPHLDLQVRELYERHARALTAYACSFGLDFSLGQDAVHQVFLKILRGEPSSQQISPGYLYRAVRNTCLNQRRDGAREVSLETETNWMVHRGGNREAEIALQAALANLPADQREVLIMRVWDGMTLDEAAAALSISINTAASRYRYALEKLKNAFGVDKQAGLGRDQ